MASCRSCGAEIIWVESSASGKPMPLDAEGQKRIIVSRGESGQTSGRVVDTYVSHFATCPNAVEHRREGSEVEL